MARGRKKKSVLNQKVEEPIVATPEQIKEMEEEGAKMLTKLVDEKIQEDLKNLKPEPVVEAKITVGGAELLTKIEEKEEVESPVYEDDGEEEGEKEVEEVSRPVGIRGLDKEFIKTLSRRDLRYFQRTGKLPK